MPSPGQALKDLLKVPRPACPPVIRLDTKWELEYGLPSTHAMVGAAMPFSIFILSLNRYQVSASGRCGQIIYSSYSPGVRETLRLMRHQVNRVHGCCVSTNTTPARVW